MTGLSTPAPARTTAGRGPGATGRGRRRGGPYRWSARAFSLPAILFVAVLLYLPFLWTAAISFTEYDGLGSPEWVGWANYTEMFADPNFTTSMRNTLMWVVGTITVPVGLGLLIAVLTHDMRFGAWFRLPFLLTYAVSPVAVGVVWTFVLQNGGGLSQALDGLGLPGADSRWLLDEPLNTLMMIGAWAWQQTGVNALLFVIGLQSIPKEPLEAARLDGASGWRMFRHMLWPMLRPLTTVVVGLALVASLKTFDIVMAMTEGGPGRNSETLALTMYREAFVSSAYGAGSAVALFLTVVTLVAAITYLRRQLSTKHEI
ncbi:carbohydrate ABC transporter membrane protein 1 (CUT1 family) [Haloactinopolyspora alba]|uniref:Carbohydrate ABC transporter membrane protein 1 (CUT1 family) n=1 Tax=Haloactinopolyspora alba TaxID=648780 RepID=A0A2P8DXC8_9ACTN|nr:sugar ABC transporter permease [Haloactinopolyspora alba]PSL01875.1 carbohydrate ABC transporter membrane protein 1 (CUT1 family) [Haloactinopolyspora alba]